MTRLSQHGRARMTARKAPAPTLRRPPATPRPRRPSCSPAGYWRVKQQQTALALCVIVECGNGELPLSFAAAPAAAGAKKSGN
jgi:hypothetical protein